MVETGKRTYYIGVRTRSLSGMGTFLLVLGIISLVGGAALAYFEQSVMWLALGISSVIWGALMSAVLKGAAEALLVLQRIAESTERLERGQTGT